MTTLKETTANRVRIEQAEQAWEQMLSEVLERGYHGTVSIEAAIQDGTIQYLRRRQERIEK